MLDILEREAHQVTVPAFTSIEVSIQDNSFDIQAILDDVMNDRMDYQEFHRELAIRLLLAEWSWPAFDEWHRYFMEIGYFPRVWQGLEYEEPSLSRAGEEYLAALRNLPLNARRLLHDVEWLGRLKVEEVEGGK